MPRVLIKLALMLVTWMISAIVVWSGFVIWQGQPASMQELPLLLFIMGVLAFSLSMPTATPMVRMVLLLAPWMLGAGWWGGGLD